MTFDFSPLNRELARWRAQGLTLPIWWRDDDAIAATPQLEKLSNLARDLHLPVHLAVIPKPAHSTLCDFVKQHAEIIPVVHGWQHQSHAREGAKKAEFGDPRPDAMAEAGQALARMKGLFDAALFPMFVPPWNRLDQGLLPGLADLGYCAVSTYLPRPAREAACGIVQINTHIDPIFWRGDRGLAPADGLIEGIVHLLSERRMGRSDAREPLGFLTHHLVHTDAVWDFTRGCLDTLLDGGAQPANLRDLP